MTRESSRSTRTGRERANFGSETQRAGHEHSSPVLEILVYTAIVYDVVRSTRGVAK